MFVSPPGKRLQSITLLSGGEQALTALSLVFAVFLVNPSPICVLDEVDAPLDDANVTRFCALLDELTKITKTKNNLRKTKQISIILVFFGTRMIQDDSSFSSWYPIKSGV